MIEKCHDALPHFAIEWSLKRSFEVKDGEVSR